MRNAQAAAQCPTPESSAEPDPAHASDVNHASDLIKKKLIRENSTPDKALRFSNLYSRLLSQPILSKKWAILYLFYQLADSEHSPPAPPSLQTASGRHPSQQSNGGPALQSPTPEQRKEVDKQFLVDSPAFNDAFSKNGLPRLPTTQGPGGPRPPSTERSTKSNGRGAEQSEAGAQLLATNVKDYLPLYPSESTLLRDLPFTLQGLSSTHLLFSTLTTLDLPPTLPVPMISLLHTLAEPSLLYRGLSKFVEASEGGLVGQSLRAAIGLELRSYLGLVATLEGQIRRALSMLDEAQPRDGLGKAGVTLKRCVVWTREATMGLRLMSLMVEESRGKKGGELISLIHNYSSTHGDPFVSAFSERLLSHITRPFYSMLRHWIYDGELEDPYLEFFVSENHDTSSAATSVWEDKYRISEAMIPTIATAEFASKVFLIGKSLNFIRYGCGDSAWVESYSKTTSRELRYGDTATLETSIDEAYRTTMARLIHLMETKFNLHAHLRALKSYLLLGRGDFIALLMESLASNLDRPAGSQYRHTLTAQLEHATRNSNAWDDGADVLRRLDARMLELSHGEIGWDVFTLEYRIDAPIDVIITPWASKQYLKVFNFLWRVKRVEFALGSTWRRCMTGARGVLATVSDKVGDDWKIARGAIGEMIHFVNQLQYYILFEVIEASWESLEKAIRKPNATLDDLIEAHSTYLKSITRKGLLGSQTIDFTSQLHKLLKCMLAYKDAVDGLYSFCVAEFTRRQEASARIETRTAAGKWGITERDHSNDYRLASPSGPNRRDADSPLPASFTGFAADEDAMLPMLRTRLADLSAEFRRSVEVLLGDLAYQPDPDMRFLGVVMNFNDVYHPVRRSKKRGDRDGRAKETPQQQQAGGAEQKGREAALKA
ncbi:Microtubule-nucleating Tub4p (gamma-tubulin) complex component [Cryomyces antarcticus]|uniref:Microtubule-nucleating Tub4p (Gamma-tubulin) complex component n=1 Tax=Cryomyces antarcticus TaxID=329879 RepID=A0ABR0KUC4_9PEZI|nr:Microtubule-nucleating Tub4p (gamma-tubulin) complex component [Cryomyces antarcticus]KAK5021153.1 Microtubule-nucleating Tub4p (gamma-tubulin) complex component [Cryomyces antarcticus]KAK5131359.1 Microtubule-nucleating Tub4p (gamma-tubulin) complex component [Cryomyces antarcticus]